VTSYRCYFLDRNERINGVQEIAALNDTAAIDRARAVLEREPLYFTAVEVWTGPRKVDYASR